MIIARFSLEIAGLALRNYPKTVIKYFADLILRHNDPAGAGGDAVGHGVGEVRIPKRIGENGQPGFGQPAVSAHVIRLCARINNVASGQFGQFSDRGQNAVGGAFGTRIHQHDAIDPDLNADISASPGDHVKVRPDLHDIQPAARLLTASDRGCAKDNQNPSGPQASSEC